MFFTELNFPKGFLIEKFSPAALLQVIRCHLDVPSSHSRFPLQRKIYYFTIMLIASSSTSWNFILCLARAIFRVSEVKSIKLNFTTRVLLHRRYFRCFSLSTMFANEKKFFTKVEKQTITSISTWISCWRLEMGRKFCFNYRHKYQTM